MIQTLPTAIHKPTYPLLKEFVRKILHSLIAVVALLAVSHPYWAFGLLFLGCLSYLLCEVARLSGYRIPLITSITTIASRKRDEGRLVWGPLTLAFGAMLSLAIFPPAMASMGILALAFGDGIASLVGKSIGYHRPAFLYGKSIEGSLACFTLTFISLYSFSGDKLLAFLLALLCTFTEALPLKNFDNIAIPFVVSLGSLLYYSASF